MEWKICQGGKFEDIFTLQDASDGDHRWERLRRKLHVPFISSLLLIQLDRGIVNGLLMLHLLRDSAGIQPSQCQKKRGFLIMGQTAQMQGS
jgi:hypothetical protein